MKLIKFIAAVSLVASTSLVSGGNATPAGMEPQIAACTDWPFCREEIEITEQSKNVARACTDWPFCREVETIGISNARLQVKSEGARKAA